MNRGMFWTSCVIAAIGAGLIEHHEYGLGIYALMFSLFVALDGIAAALKDEKQ